MASGADTVSLTEGLYFIHQLLTVAQRMCLIMDERLSDDYSFPDIEQLSVISQSKRPGADA